MHFSVATLTLAQRDELACGVILRFHDDRVRKPKQVVNGAKRQYRLHKTVEIYMQEKYPKSKAKAIVTAKQRIRKAEKKGIIMTMEQAMRKDKTWGIGCMSCDIKENFFVFVDFYLENGGVERPRVMEVSNMFYREYIPHVLDYYGLDANTCTWIPTDPNPFDTTTVVMGVPLPMVHEETDEDVEEENGDNSGSDEESDDSEMDLISDDDKEEEEEDDDVKIAAK